MSELMPCPFAIGDIVYVLGKYYFDFDAPLLLMECKISHIKHRQFVAYRTDGESGEWRFSKKHYNQCVFKTREEAEQAFRERVAPLSDKLASAEKRSAETASAEFDNGDYVKE